jgi:hypothetical protein
VTADKASVAMGKTLAREVGMHRSWARLMALSPGLVP